MRDDLMVQQQIANAWEHMVGVIMLNQTDRRQVKRVLPEFLKQFPTPSAAASADIADIEQSVKSLGMYRTRAKRIKRMSEQYLTWDHRDAAALYGIGKYGSDSYEIFFHCNYSVQPTDKELIKYLKETICL